MPLRDQHAGHPAQGQHVVRPTVEDFSVSLDRRLASVTKHERVRPDVRILDIERAGLLIIRLGIVGPAEPAEASRGEHHGGPAKWPPRQMAFSDLEGRLQLIPAVRRLGRDQRPGLELEPENRRQQSDDDHATNHRQAHPARWRSFGFVRETSDAAGRSDEPVAGSTDTRVESDGVPWVIGVYSPPRAVHSAVRLILFFGSCRKTSECQARASSGKPMRCARQRVSGKALDSDEYPNR